MASKKGGGNHQLVLCLATFVLFTILLSTLQMMLLMLYLKADTSNALHFVAGEHGVPSLVWNGAHHMQTKAHSEQFGAAPALRGRVHAAAHGILLEQCHLGGPFGGYIPGCSLLKGCAEYPSFAKAMNACLEDRTCGGITAQNEATYQLRAWAETQPSPTGSEMSYRKFCSETSEPPPVVQLPPPAEWEPPPGYEQNYEAPGRHVDGEPTIFISIASYRDDLCHNTIKEALRMADHPRRLFLGAVEQSIPSQGDLPCNFTMTSCDDDPEQLLCIHAHQISVDRVDARGAQGPTYGRYRADRLYRGEHYALQIDAHTYFVAGWDTKMISQWKATGNEYAVITTYPSDYKPGYLDGKGHSNHPSTPVICKSHFGDGGMVRHDGADEIYPKPAVKESPILQPVWAAGSSFSRGHRVARVPYDLLPMVFDGEEFVMAMRMWTWGYDFYTFRRLLILHPYARKTWPNTFWENQQDGSLTRGAHQRVNVMLGLERPPVGYDINDIAPGAKYGLGTRRKLSTYLTIWGYDLKHKKARDNCPWAISQDMHFELTSYLQKDGRGIDYAEAPIEALMRKHKFAPLPDQQLLWSA